MSYSSPLPILYQGTQLVRLVQTRTKMHLMSLTTRSDEAGRLWGVEQVAEYLDVTVHAIYKWRVRGLGPPAAKVGRQLRYDPEDIRAWLESQKR